MLSGRIVGSFLRDSLRGQRKKPVEQGGGSNTGYGVKQMREQRALSPPDGDLRSQPALQGARPAQRQGARLASSLGADLAARP